jgi:HK97 family phage major capsid protein
MNINKMTLEQIEARKLEIKSIVENKDENSDFEALSAEIDALEERAAFLKEEQRKEDIHNVIEGVNTEEHTIELPKEERQMKTLNEVRNSAEYVNAFAEYIKTEKNTECRALLSELATEDGQVPVPTFVEDTIKTAWEKEGILSRVKKSYIAGIIRVGFEVSATAAAYHNEGDDAPSEEELVLGVIELKPATIKKWITISDEVYDLKGEAFIRYIYDELTHQIAKFAAKTLIGLIDAAPATATTSAVSVPVVEADQIAIDTVAQAISKLSDEASDPVIVINKATFAAFRAVQYANGYAVDPFEGLNIEYNNALPAFEDAEAGDTWLIVGDFGLGAQANYPNGEDIKIKFDDLTLADKDLIKIVGRQYVALGLVADKAFVKVAKAGS